MSMLLFCWGSNFGSNFS